MGKFLFMCVLYLICTATYATVAGDIGNTFNALGFKGNVTHASAYQGQQAGYYSGGSLYFRNQVKNLQIVHLDVPSISGGCNGIDVYTGGFSFINSDGLVTLAKQTIASAKAQFFFLALKTVAPMVETVTSKLQTAAQVANNMNLNSCQLGQTLAGGLWPKLKATSAQICQTIGTEKNIFSDWAASRQGCGTGGDMNEMLNEASNNKEYKSQTLINKNLIWDNLRQEALLATDTELAELLMSLSGTIIFDAKGKPTFLTPMADNRGLIKTLLNGGDTELYICDESNKCLNPEIQTFHLAAEKGLRSQVGDFIQILIDKVKTDFPLTEKEKGFLNATHVPILKFITVGLSTNQLFAIQQLDTLQDVISEDLLKQYLLENLNVIRASLKRSDYADGVIEKLMTQVQRAILAVNALDSQQSQKLKDALALIKNAQDMETKEAARVMNLLSPHSNLEGG